MSLLKETLLIFTDLDGTLLDIHTYDWRPATPWLNKLQDHQIPVILCSSKTAAETLEIQQDLGLEGLPFIAENGAVVQLDVRWDDHPNAPRLINGTPHSEICSLIDPIRERAGYKFTTFDDVDERVIGEWTGLSRERSALARLHEASVTLIWRDSDERMAQFGAELVQLGFKFVQGARFWHILDARGGKDQAVNWLIDEYRKREGFVPTTIGLGDGPNDAPLLDNVDYAVVVKGINRHGIQLQDDIPERVYHTTQPGPEGWREGLDHFLSASRHTT
ncbi:MULTISPECIES: mannosyl-3-phosphoglycerate phosphatase-related protein [Lelliottia]|uniref:Mannosyl-3-phosphoglycerate phosphatase-related protein n=1 Tax=Lelliottia aquatilis TaxID=2080838 RepID=A0ABX4ZZA3_9ENTR|nr:MULTISPECIES: mannosyl-3-phosphoglycerate phosphatase-related protein [Lelliottia]NTZ44500.1 mannosyl-3-phosphoglycerate phosphatase-related protein [Lelliottia aquatilis]POZ18254.1 mannosyl-3-phosphoglycerate phosphatase-related protein [Lelliottia sp. 7254-16]POZ21693.1 mannosyl-3-phosphoglycerate phosphatase-related protein [Lelliottia aquatilis]POZ23825.1 mannosyl-3-phosphoglycerate phosphatase-related protein [Lelliottia aquatilis]POZ31569.1 mannosyl-3-phosphoglycerate phosphatase-rela